MKATITARRLVCFLALSAAVTGCMKVEKKVADPKAPLPQSASDTVVGGSTSSDPAPTLQMDASFGNDGKVIHSLSSRWDAVRALGFQATTGKIIAAGLIHNKASADGIPHSNKFHVALTRYAANGTVDRTFGGANTGVQEYKPNVPNTVGDLQPSALKVSTDGTILLASNYTSTATTNADFHLMKFRADGTVDTQFGTKQVGFGTVRGDYAKAIAVDGSGRIYIAGYTQNPAATSASHSGGDMAVIRFKPDPANAATVVIDTAFEADGKYSMGDIRDSSGLTKFGTTGNSVVNTMAIDGNGRAVIAGYVYNVNHTDFAVARLNVDGTLDTSFNGTGAMAFDFGSSQDDQVHAMVIQSDGKILLAGSTVIDKRPRFAAARFFPDGTLDSSFGSNGRVTTAFDIDAYATGIAVAGSKIILTGYALKGNTYEFAAAKYSAAGALENKSTISFGNSFTSYSRAALPMADGSVVLAGETYTGPNQFDFSLAKVK